MWRSYSDDGYGVMLGFDRDGLEKHVNELYKKTGVVTIPHSRYYYNSSAYYCFRINLATETHTLLTSLEKILHIFYEIYPY